jgi:hypothetical protein
MGSGQSSAASKAGAKSSGAPARESLEAFPHDILEPGIADRVMAHDPAVVD